MIDVRALDGTPDYAFQKRSRQILLERLADKVRRAEAALDRAVSERDEAMIEAHGDRRYGRLSYEEMATVLRLSKGRVIQIVQGESEYSKAQYAKKTAGESADAD